MELRKYFMRDIIPPEASSGNLPEEGLKNLAYCPVCHYHYNPIQAKVLEEGNGVHLIYVKCSRCQSSILALVLAGNFGISSIGLITDLDGGEIIKFKSLPPVSGNDVLRVYETLQKSEKLEQIFV